MSEAEFRKRNECSKCGVKLRDIERFNNEGSKPLCDKCYRCVDDLRTIFRNIYGAV